MVTEIKTGIFWGCFDPPTLAHQAIIYEMAELFDDNYIIVKNNVEKNYFAPIEHRLEMLYSILPEGINKFTVLIQDLQNSNNYFDVRKIVSGNLYVVVGTDALHSWLQQHQTKELAKYDGIYVVPRDTSSSNEITQLTKINKLSIDSMYKDVSSTTVRAALGTKSKNYSSIKLDNNVLKYINNVKLYSV